MKKLTMLVPVIALICTVMACEPSDEKIANDTPKIKTTETVLDDHLVTSEDKVFTIVEDQPQPPNGMAAFNEYVKDNLKYPEKARKMGIEGKVFVQFVVNKEGQLTDVVSVKGIGAGCDEEAVKVVKNSPSWKPGLQRGQKVAVRMILPVAFKLN